MRMHVLDLEVVKHCFNFPLKDYIAYEPSSEEYYSESIDMAGQFYAARHVEPILRNQTRKDGKWQLKLSCLLLYVK